LSGERRGKRLGERLGENRVLRWIACTSVDGGCLSGDDATYLGEPAVFDMCPHQGFCKFVALAAAAAYVQLLSDVFHGFGTVIERPANRFVGDVMAYANDHGDAPPVWARRLLDDYP